MSQLDDFPIDLGLSLAMAVVASSHAPTLLLDENRQIISASDAFCQAFGIDSATIVGRNFASLGDGEWAISQMVALLKATAAGLAEVKDYEFELKSPGREARSLVLNAHKLNYGEGGAIRMLLAIADVTAAQVARKLNDDLVRDKSILMQELQHRVANSLQIIASVLMQSAKNVQSDEARRHLREAHHRVMSVATVQKQLAVSAVKMVQLRPYLSHLCESIGASMIRDPNQLSIKITADDSSVEADVSISLGLVVTELVINALKHAFPLGQIGHIEVDYEQTGGDWTLSVSDDGVGMKTNGATPKAGLGTTIVQALATQLDAEITVTDNDPGTMVSLDHVAPTVEDGVTAAKPQPAV